MRDCATSTTSLIIGLGPNRGLSICSADAPTTEVRSTRKASLSLYITLRSSLVHDIAATTLMPRRIKTIGQGSSANPSVQQIF